MPAEYEGRDREPLTGIASQLDFWNQRRHADVRHFALIVPKGTTGRSVRSE